ncbi:MAG: TRAP transporter small permease [Clostridiales Family XIII bacterium]|jgi:TRAP-type C4-dicarboxylate transport system permease small subunit|nr:TRAP transporter small permease [Clostridiales Family XIII bacterium]
MAKFSKTIDMLTDKVSYAAMASCFFLMCMTAIHVILRKVSYFSVPGAMELTELSLVVIVFCAIGYLQSQGGHVRVNMFVDMLPLRARSFVSFVILLLSAVALFLMFYAGLRQIGAQFETGLATNVLKIPIWPFVIIMTIGIIFYALSLLVHAIEALIVAVRGDGGEEKGKGPDDDIAFDV